MVGLHTNKFFAKSHNFFNLSLFLYNRHEKAVHAQEETEESLKRRPMSAGEPEMSSQVLKNIYSPDCCSRK